jgi:hypothetical protein
MYRKRPTTTKSTQDCVKPLINDSEFENEAK